MPVEIKELVIKATISSTENNTENRASITNKDEIIRDCVEEVLKIIKRENER